jgi:hypothetical protein
MLKLQPSGGSLTLTAFASVFSSGLRPPERRAAASAPPERKVRLSIRISVRIGVWICFRFSRPCDLHWKAETGIKTCRKTHALRVENKKIKIRHLIKNFLFVFN